MSLSRLTKTPAQWYSLGETFYNDENYDEAKTCYEEALKQDSMYFEASYSLGWLYEFHFQNLIKAKEYYKKAVESGDESTDFNRSQARILKITHPSFSDVDWSDLGVTCYKAKPKNYIKAKICFELAIAANTKNLKANYFLGWMWEHKQGVSKKDVATARKYYEIASAGGDVLSKKQLIILDGHSASSVDGWNSLGDIYYDKEDEFGAKVCYLQAIKLNPNHPYSLYSIGWLLYENKNLSGECVNYFEKAIKNRDSNGNTAMMIAAKRGEMEVIQVLIRLGAPLHLTNSSMETASQIAAQNEEWDIVEYLLKEREKISLTYLDKIFTHCESEYKGTFDTRKKDKDLLDQEISLLTGVQVKMARMNTRWKLLGNFHELKGSIIDVRRESKEEKLEGIFHLDEVLSVRIRSQFELALKISKGRIPEDSLPLHQQQMIESIKKEILVNLELLQCYRDTNRVITISGINKKRLIEAQAKNIGAKVETLKDGEEYSYSTGYVGKKNSGGHYTYVNFFRRTENIFIRVDNLGDGYKDHPHLLSKRDKMIDVVRPCFIGCVPVKNFSKVPAHIQYIEGIITANFKERDEAFALIYKPLGVKKSHPEVKTWTAKRPQVVGNCAIAGHNAGMHFRLSGGKDSRECALLYKWLLKEESKEVSAYTVEGRKISKAT